MVLVKSLVLRGTADFGKAKAGLDDVAARARKVGEMKPTVNLNVDDGAALLKLKAFSMELRALKDSGNQAGLQDLATRLKSFGNEAGATRTKMAALKLEADALKFSMSGGPGGGGLAGAAGEAESGLAGLSGSGGMGALIGAGVALAPVVTTLGFGLGGLAAAAVGVIGPIEKAASKTGGLEKNMASLDPEQRRVAEGLIGLKGVYGAFQKTLEPEVLGIFSTGLRAARHLMADVAPVAKATGSALDVMLGRVDAEFQSGQWQSFFQWMAANAGPDLRLLGDDLTGLLKVVPPTVRALDPLGKLILSTGRDIQWFENNVPGSTKTTLDFAHAIDRWTVSVTNHLPGGKWINESLSRYQPEAAAASKATALLAAATTTMTERNTAAAKALGVTSAAVTTLMGDENKALTAQLAYSGDLVAAANDAKGLKDALKHSHGMIGLHTQAERDSFAAANTYISQLDQTAQQAFHSKRGVDGAISSIKGGLPTLRNAKSDSKAYWEEVKTLVHWLHELERVKRIRETIRITGTGRWAATAGELPGQPGGHFVGRFAAGTPGAAPGWAWVGERGPELVRMTGGETVLPHPASVRAARGYASGILGDYSGTVPGLRRWAQHDYAATIQLITAGVARSLYEAAQAMASGGSGALGGDPAANRALARRMFPWPAYMWTDQDLLVMRESGWNRFARNPSSGAYGIAQALPPTKYPFAGQAAGGSHAGAQIGWLYGYERGRYGTPLRAWGHEMAFGWYDDGKGWLPPGLSLALNTTGKPEPVGRGGNTYNITVKVPVSANKREVGREVVEAIREYEKGSGPGWRR